MADGIRVVIKNEKQFLARWNKKVQGLTDMRRPMNLALDVITESIIKGVTTGQGDVDGKPFVKLSTRYASRKLAIYGSKPILVAEEEMLDRKHFKKTASRDKGILKYEAEKKVMTRALTHQKPITWPGPQRKWWGLRSGVIGRVMAVLGKHVKITVKG